MQQGNVLLELEWLHDETSETEDFILVESRKNKRERRKSLKIFAVTNAKMQDHENPACPKKRGRPRKATSSKNVYKKRNDNARSSLELQGS